MITSAHMTDNAPPDLTQQGKELHRTIDFGFQVEAFVQGEIGQYLIKHAEEAIAEAVEELKIADPALPDGIRAIQMRIQVAERIQYWLAEAIQSGYAAQDELIDQQA